MKEEFEVNEVCECYCPLHGWEDCEILEIGNPRGLASHPILRGDYTILTPSCPNKWRTDKAWLAEETSLRKKPPPEQKDTQVAEDDFIDDFKKLIERQEEPA